MVCNCLIMMHAGHSPGPEILDQFAKATEARLSEFSAQNISNTLSSYAKLEHAPTELLAATAKAALPKLGTFNSQVPA